MGTPISSELKALFMAEKRQTATITVTPTEGNPFTITDADIMMSTLMIDRTVMEGSSLNLGSCVASELNMTLNNWDGKFNGRSWESAELSIELGVEGSNETLPMGVFYVDGSPKKRDIIGITALDGMTKFDKSVYDPEEFWLDGMTPSHIISYCCTKCGVTLATDITDFPNADVEFGVDNLHGYASLHPEFTFRHFLSSAVALLGKCAWMNADGELEIGFFPIRQQPEDRFYQSNRYSSDYDNPITVWGFNFTKASTGATFSTNPDSEYYFDLTGNVVLDYAYYISGDGTTTIDEVLDNIQNYFYEQQHGSSFIYTPLTMDTVPCPHIFPTDVIGFEIDPNSSAVGNRFITYVTSCTFQLNSHTSIAAQGISPADKALPSTPTLGDAMSAIGALQDAVYHGGGGTIDYNELMNKPRIEGVVLAGDKSYAELNLNKITNTEIENDILTH